MIKMKFDEFDREFDIVVANPAGNITIFVLGAETCSAEQCGKISKALLADKTLRAEQVGFVTPALCGQRAKNDLWRLQMMGGEFCGNAARSFGLYVAQQTGITKKSVVSIAISGSKNPVAVEVDVQKNFAAVEIPPPIAATNIKYKNMTLPVYIFEGITHVIAQDIPLSKKTFLDIQKIAESAAAQTRLYPLNGSAADTPPLPDALGVMFYDSAKQFLQPAVYVYQTDSLVFESSCGSGSAAFALAHFSAAQDGAITIKQPGGSIDVFVQKQADRLSALKIGGAVTLS
jgi:diaminopimelate epimerase